MKIDHDLQGCPSFHTHDITVGDEVVTLHAGNILDYYHTSMGHTRSQVYHDMHTVDWWWEVQVCKFYSLYCLDVTDFD